MKFITAVIAIAGLGLLGASVYAADTSAGDATQTPHSLSSAAQQNTTTQQGHSTMSGEDFLAANRLKPGVVTLPDGLQYKILTQGTGPKPKDTDVVVVHYVGTLIDGTEFDSSYKRNEPATFPVNGVIPGWVEALKLMPVGSTWMLFIPANLAYGEQGAPPAIAPNQTLIFKVNLLEIKKS